MAPNTPHNEGNKNFEKEGVTMMGRRAFIVQAAAAGIVMSIPKIGRAEDSIDGDTLRMLSDLDEMDDLAGALSFWDTRPLHVPLTPEVEAVLMKDLAATVRIRAGQRTYTEVQHKLMDRIERSRPSNLDRAQFERIEAKMKQQYFQ